MPRNAEVTAQLAKNPKERPEENFHPATVHDHWRLSSRAQIPGRLAEDVSMPDILRGET